MRRSRRTVTALDVRSAVAFGAVLAVCGAVFFAVLAAGLWVLASMSGTTDRLDGFLQSAGASSNVHVGGARLLRGIVVVDAVGIVASTLAWTLMVLLFNAVAPRVGGLRVTVLEVETASGVPMKGLAMKSAEVQRDD